jgi:hypothetical protein
MRRALLALFVLLTASNVVAQVGTLDGYVNISLSADEARISSAADVTYLVSQYFNCSAYANATTCVFTLSGTHAIQPGFQASFSNVSGYHYTLEGPSTPQTCY